MMINYARSVLRLTCIWTGIHLVALSGCTIIDKQEDRAHHIWKRHERVFEEALKGNQKGEKLGAACLFFEELTEIKLHVDIFTLGYLPQPEAEKDLELLRTWYRNNRGRLYWDESEQKVKLKQDS